MSVLPPSDLYLARARAAASSKDCMDIYDKWAESYNDEVTNKDQNYVAPDLVAQMALRTSVKSTKAIILDAGCGTGLVGQCLAAAGAKTIDGIDLSRPMLNIAERTGAYRYLAEADLNQPINKPTDTYDIVTCVGTFTAGHVGPEPALREFIRITKKDGIIVATILEEIWTSGGFQSEVEKLKASKSIIIINDKLIDYVKGHGDRAVLLVLRKSEPAGAK